MKLAGLNMSYYEHAALEQISGVDSISAVKAIQIANENEVPIHQVDDTNINAILPLLQVSKAVKSDIQNAINAGKVVIIPERNIQRNNWNGVGYIILDPDTGEGTYMISGGLAGAESTIGVRPIFLLEWLGYLMFQRASVCLGEMISGTHLECDGLGGAEIKKNTVAEAITERLDSFEAIIQTWCVWLLLVHRGYWTHRKRTETEKEFLDEVSWPSDGKNYRSKIFYFVGHGGFENKVNTFKYEFDKGEPIYLLLKKDGGDDGTVSPKEIEEASKHNYLLVFLNSCFSAENDYEFFKAFAKETQKNPTVGIGWKKEEIYKLPCPALACTRDCNTGGEPTANVLAAGWSFWDSISQGKTIREAYNKIVNKHDIYNNFSLYEMK